MTAREEIAEAANLAEGIDCSPYYRLATEPGKAYVELLRTEYPNKFGGVDYWGVVVVLPTDLAAAQRWMDEHRAPLKRALYTEGQALVVDQIRPYQIQQTDGPIIKAMVVEGHRESEE